MKLITEHKIANKTLRLVREISLKEILMRL